MSEISKISSESETLGNTKLRSRRYQITINNYNKEENLKNLMGFQYLVGYEIAPTTGTPHCHIYLESKTQIALSKIKSLFPTGHIEICKGNRESNIEYVTKDGNFEGNIKVEKPYTYKDVIKGELYPWQQEIEDLITAPPDDRKIYWFWEEKGNVGKTTFAKYLSMKYDYVLYSRCTKSADIVMGASPSKSVYILDLPRSNAHFEPWNAIEQLKDGFICDAKLKKEVRTVCIRPPHVIIFSNHEPEKSKLSEDRWFIKKL